MMYAKEREKRRMVIFGNILNKSVVMLQFYKTQSSL